MVVGFQMLRTIQKGGEARRLSSVRISGGVSGGVDEVVLRRYPRLLG